jgi:DHA2 family multidrug resistance protein-like MFS transporter
MSAIDLDRIPEDGLPAPELWYATIVIALGTFIAVLDSTITNVALPSFVRAFAIDPSSSIWIVNAFQLSVIATLLPFSALGDRISHRRVYQNGLLVFTIGSLACALSHNFGQLVAARILQGLGAGGVLSIGPAMYRIIFPHRQLGLGIGISALIVATSSALGPTLGGFILSIAPWPWLFFINVPLGVIDCILARLSLPNSARRDKKLDVISMLASGAGLALMVLGFDGMSRHVQTGPAAIAFSIGAAAFGYFVYRQMHITNPLVEPRLFQVRRFRLAALTSFVSFMAQGLALVSLPFLIRTTVGGDPFQIGLLLSTWPLAIALIGPLSGRLADRFPASVLSTIGLAILGIGLLLQGSQSVAHATVWGIAWRSVICGAGFGFFQPPNNRELMGSGPRELAGNASGILSTVRVMGQTVGAAIAALMLAQVDIDQGAHEALLIAGAIALAALCVSGTRLFQRGEAATGAAT